MYLGVGDDNAEETKEETVIKRAIGEYDPTNVKNQVLFTSMSEQDIIDLIILKLQDKDVTPELHPKKWKLTYTRTREVESGENKEIEAQRDSCKV